MLCSAQAFSTTGRPITGARIETASNAGPPPRHPVAPSQGRGSKLILAHDVLVICKSPHHRGADRNRHRSRSRGTGRRSPHHRGADRNSLNHHRLHQRNVAPSQGRGSKQQRLEDQSLILGAPSQGRGSKHPHLRPQPHPRRSPHHRGADRNKGYGIYPLGAQCRPITGARIETRSRCGPASTRAVAPSQGRGSKLLRHREVEHDARSPHHRGADRNKR